MKRLWLDFETRSLVNIKNSGLDRYAHDPSTQVLMLAWAVDMAVPQLWQPRLGPMPAELRAMLLDQTIKLCAWNYNFEKDILEFVLDIPTEQSRWYDPSILCAYMSLPIGLHRAGDALSVADKKIHIIGDDRPVKMFSVAKKAGKKMLAAGMPALYFRDWDSNPTEWQTFCEYCIQDVVSERDVHFAATSINSPMTQGEYEAWQLDQRMNSTGVYVDMDFVLKGKKLAMAEADQLLAKMGAITGCENPNSGDQLKAWLKPREYPFDSLDVEHIEEALKLSFLKPEVREILELKQKLGGSAYKKFQSILDRISEDGRLRDQFVYHGAHTGRWSGRGVQLQNLYKPDKAASKVAKAIIDAIRAETLVSGMFPGIDVMTCIASVIRTSFCAAPGHKLVVGDLAQIESRVLAALSGCQTMIDAYTSGHDLYIEFMSWLLGKPLTKEDNPDERGIGKVVILGSGFGMGVDKFVDYCATFGLVMPLSSDDPDEVTAEKCIYGFREKYKEIPLYWKALENACKEAVRYHKCIYVKGVVVDGRNPRVLKIKLPSGRYIHYFDARLVKKKKFGKMMECVCYTAYDSKGAQEKDLYGGLICENVVQAVARDLLLHGMLEAEKMGFKIIMTIHDEIVAEVLLTSHLTDKDLYVAMSTNPEWAFGMGFVLAAEGYEGQYYKK
jgi:DNA polymerase bacteriophage-type